MDKIPVDLPVEFEIKEHEALMSIWLTGSILRKISDELFGPELASAAQFNVLLLLKAVAVPVTQNELSRKMLVNRSNITGLIDRLEKQGLIARRAVEGDRRSYHVGLTPKGRTLVGRLEERYLKAVRGVMRSLNGDEVVKLIELNRKVRSGLREAFGS